MGNTVGGSSNQQLVEEITNMGWGDMLFQVMSQNQNHLHQDQCLVPFEFLHRIGWEN